MKTVIENAVKALAAKAENAPQPHEAMNYAQAALNLTHAYATLEGVRHANEAKK